MKLKQFEVPGLAHYSYLLSSNGKAIVIDPKRDIDTYLTYAEELSVTISHVLETHIHADYASGATALSHVTGAELWLSGHDAGEEFEYQFEHNRFFDGDEIQAGELRVVALHTPGHTPEHLSFLAYEKSRCGQPVALFTGDFIFVGSLGRPDLLGEASKTKLAGALYDSIHTRVENLPDGVELYPAHGAGSLCGSGMAERAQSTLGYERFCNIFMAGRSKEKFVETILQTVPPFPEYYRRMNRVNSEGPRLLRGLPGGEALEATEFRQQIEAIDPAVIDLRRPEAFGGAHIPDAFNIGSGPNLPLWAGWVLPYDRPILVVGDRNMNLEEARRALIRVGFDDIRGYLKHGMQSWIEAGFEQAHVRQESVPELMNILPSKPLVLDVRSAAEWESGHIAGAIHIPGGELPHRVHEVPAGAPVHVICGSGYRSSIATSVLARAGMKDVVNVAGGMGAWNARNYPVDSR